MKFLEFMSGLDYDIQVQELWAIVITVCFIALIISVSSYKEKNEIVCSKLLSEVAAYYETAPQKELPDSVKKSIEKLCQ